VDINVFVTLGDVLPPSSSSTDDVRNMFAMTRDDWRCRGRPRSFGTVRMAYYYLTSIAGVVDVKAS